MLIAFYKAVNVSDQTNADIIEDELDKDKDKKLDENLMNELYIQTGVPVIDLLSCAKYAGKRAVVVNGWRNSGKIQ